MLYQLPGVFQTKGLHMSFIKRSRDIQLCRRYMKPPFELMNLMDPNPTPNIIKIILFPPNIEKFNFGSQLTPELKINACNALYKLSSKMEKTTWNTRLVPDKKSPKKWLNSARYFDNTRCKLDTDVDQLNTNLHKEIGKLCNHYQQSHQVQCKGEK